MGEKPDKRRLHLAVQRAAQRLKETCDELYGREHTWTIAVQIRGDVVQFWRREVVHKPIEPDAA